MALFSFEKYSVKLKVPFKINQHAYKKHPKKYRSKRQMAETFFAQMCDQLDKSPEWKKISSNQTCFELLIAQHVYLLFF